MKPTMKRNLLALAAASAIALGALSLFRHNRAPAVLTRQIRTGFLKKKPNKTNMSDKRSEINFRGRNQGRPKRFEERKIKLMKNRSSITTLITILSVIGSFALLPKVKAAPEVTPPPDGCYPGFTTAEGCLALQNLTSGSGNTGVGWRSLFLVGDGSFNTGVGVGAVLSNNADNNTAVGAAALLLNATGGSNTAVGTAALENDTGGPFNTAVGLEALMNTTANANVAVGDLALINNTSGSFNTAIGAAAGENLTTGHNNICIGQGSFGVAGESNTVRIGDGLPTGAGLSQCFIGGILSHFVTPSLGDSLVTINTTTSQLGWTTDSAANKVAEQQKKIEEQKASINQLKIEMQTMVAQLKEQAAPIQKVSAQLEVSKPAPQVVVNKP